MKSLIFSFGRLACLRLVLPVVMSLFIAVCGVRAQQPQMSAMIEQSLGRLKTFCAAEVTGFVAEMRRIDAIWPDSVRPKYMSALVSLNWAVANPHAPETETLLGGARQDISRLEAMRDGQTAEPMTAAERSDVMTLRGFYYMVLIVQDPMRNGPRYYREVSECYDKALKLNPENGLARELQDRFREGMEQQVITTIYGTSAYTMSSRPASARSRRAA